MLGFWDLGLGLGACRNVGLGHVELAEQEAFDVTMLAVIFQGRPKSWTLIFKLKTVLYMSLVSAHWSCNSRTGA